MPRQPSLPPWSKPHYVGIDENGMGPRLGPLVVTSVLATVTDEAAAKVLTGKPRGALAKRIGDSKKLVAFDDNALGEAWARAIVARSTPGAGVRSPAELLDALAIDDATARTAPCPSHHVDLCWASEGEAFTSTDESVRACTKDLERLEAKGIRVVRTRVGIVCTRRLNEGVARGLSRFDVDLHTMERLAMAARSDAGDEVYALCGKVGGFDFYSDRFGPLAGWLHSVLVEGRARSEYHVPSVGRLAFVRDADESHLVVGLASLVGKWVRDHLMRRVVRFHRAHTADLPDASGYHDPVTTKFIEASALVRRDRRVEDACFERLSLYKEREREGAAATSSARKRSPKDQAPPSSIRTKKKQERSKEAASSSRAPRPS